MAPCYVKRKACAASPRQPVPVKRPAHDRHVVKLQGRTYLMQARFTIVNLLRCCLLSFLFPPTPTPQTHM